MRSLLRAGRASRAALLTTVFAVGAIALAASSDEAAFVAENHTAMTRMMTAMEIKPSGDIDTDFVAMMAPHHQGAIDMARAELCYGRNEQLRRLAQEIIVTQQQEIAVMRMALGQPVPSPTGAQPVSGRQMHTLRGDRERG